AAPRAPHLLIAAGVRLLDAAQTDVLIQVPAYRPGPVARHTALLLAEATRPDRILIAEGADICYDGFTVGPETVTLEPGFPPVVEAAQRKARWMGFIEDSTEQEVRLDRVAIEGARLGSGRALTLRELHRFLPTPVHADLSARTLLLV